MRFIKRIVIARHERGLYLKDRSFVRVLEPGVYWMLDPFARVQVQVYDLSVPEFTHPRVDVLVKDQAELCARYFQIVELGDREVGLVYKDGKLSALLPPATRQLYWRGAVEVRVEVISIAEGCEVPRDKVALLARARPGELLKSVTNAIVPVEIADEHVGLLIVDGELVKTLKPGLYAYWKFNRSVKVEQVDTRLQTLEVSGQEMLTKDKVSLRVNLSAAYQVRDPVLARARLSDFAAYLYRELQFAVRQAIGTRTLDVLLGNKGELDQVLYATVRDKAVEFGIEVKSVGVKDVILPGEMKDILNQVVQAEKAAQANIIKRREETAATRSLLNTARLMDENPILIRLKELEMLEKVTEKVGKLTVFGGLEGVLQDMVKINLTSE